MRKLMLLSGACLLAYGALGAPAFAKGQTKVDDSTCHLKSYSYLVGADVTDTSHISGEYRLLQQGQDRGPAKPNRVTIVYDNSNRILSVDCG